MSQTTTLEETNSRLHLAAAAPPNTRSLTILFAHKSSSSIQANNNSACLRDTVGRREDELCDTRKPAFEPLAAAASGIKFHHREAPMRQAFWDPHPHFFFVFFLFPTSLPTCADKHTHAPASSAARLESWSSACTRDTEREGRKQLLHSSVRMFDNKHSSPRGERNSAHICKIITASSFTSALINKTQSCRSSILIRHQGFAIKTPPQ